MAKGPTAVAADPLHIDWFLTLTEATPLDWRVLLGPISVSLDETAGCVLLHDICDSIRDRRSVLELSEIT